MYEGSKFNKIDYINKNTELKNIYRSYIALNIFLAKDNLDLILDIYENSHVRILGILKEAFTEKNNANLEHVMILITALISCIPNETLNVMITHFKLPLLMLKLLENEKIYQFIFKMLFHPR